MKSEYSTHKTTLLRAMKHIRKPMESLCPDTNATYLYFEKTVLPCIESKGPIENYMMPFLVLVTNPCTHITNSGGCTMCGYSNLASFRREIRGDSVYDQFKRGYEIIRRIPHHEMVALGTAGSFLDPSEVPFDIQARIVEVLDHADDIHYVNIEARAEYVTRTSLKNLVEVVDDPYRLSVGVGLESSDEWIRELCINKCLPIGAFVKAMQLLREYHISPTAYVTLGKPFINDWTNITDALKSITFAIEHGADRVVLLKLGVQSNSLVEWLYNHKLYKPIENWALVEVLNNLPSQLRGDVLVANPRLPKHIGVDECPSSSTALELLGEYKGTLDERYLGAIDELSCEHKQKWYQNLEGEKEQAYDVETQISESYERWLEVWEDEQGSLLREEYSQTSRSV